MDRLSPLLSRFPLHAKVFHSGPLCGSSGLYEGDNIGHLHLLRRGRMQVSGPRLREQSIEEPVLLLFPRACAHRLHAEEADGAELLCAAFDFSAGLGNPLLRSLPDQIVLPLERIPGLGPTLELLFAEAFAEHCGRQAAVNRLVEYVLILLLREVMDSQLLQAGLLVGLAEPRLAKALDALHQRPQENWNLQDLANHAGMSRARFAEQFRRLVGQTPMDYLTDWRLSLARQLLKSGRPLALVAPAVGYTSPEALSRVFSQRLGQSPRAWLKHQG